MPDLVHLLLINLAVSAAMFTALWVASLPLRDASIVDRFWGAGFAVIALVSAVLSGGDPIRRALVVALAAIWGLRLSLHITVRNMGSGEDPRYQAMRRRYGEAFAWKSLGIVFGLQALLLWLVSLPLQIAASSPLPAAPTWMDALGVAVWATGFAFETVGDLQLARFKADPASKGKVMDRGLWRYTRHPNYFGDALLWWGFYLLAAQVPGGAWTIFSPALMTWLLLRLSGVPMLEKQLRRTRPGYEEYCRRTSSFVPLPPRR